MVKLLKLSIYLRRPASSVMKTLAKKQKKCSRGNHNKYNNTHKRLQNRNKSRGAKRHWVNIGEQTINNKLKIIKPNTNSWISTETR